VLRRLIATAPGRRVPRSVDGPELAVRAVLGQQISTAAARTHAARLVTAHGDPISDPAGGLTHLFPTPQELLHARLAMPASRTRTIATLLSGLAGGGLRLDPDADLDQARSKLAELRGIGPWTTEIVAMRALGDGDAFPASDLGVRRGAQALGLPADPRPLTAHAEQWRPWRAYAVQYLWAATTHPINDWPPAQQAGRRGVQRGSAPSMFQ
jgi:AraC family transcriptional regulator, regulatory protein of adaptative response / DNA-3-methyladenine glycosylase II